MSEAFMDKIIQVVHGESTPLSWYRTIVYWMIDSDLRLLKKINSFLAEQINTPAPSVLALAQQLEKGAKSEAQIVNRVTKYIHENFTPRYDIEVWKKTEYWATAEEILIKKEDDCDGLNSLCYILCRLAGVSDMSIFCNLGDVLTPVGREKHFYVTFFSTTYAAQATAFEKQNGGRLVRCDLTYFPVKDTVEQRPSFSQQISPLADDYPIYYPMDYCFNEHATWRVKNE